MKIRSALVTLAIALLFSGGAQAEEITLGIGQQWMTDRGDLQQISVANPKVARAVLTPDGRQIIVTALKPGQTDLVLWNAQHEKTLHSLRVLNGDVRGQSQDVQALLGELEGIRVRTLGDQILIEGEALRLEDLKRIQQVTGLFSNAQNWVRMSPGVAPLLTREMNDKLATYGFSDLRAAVIGDKIYLTGDALNEQRHQQALTVARALYPEIADLTRLKDGSQPAIRMDLTLLELNRTHTHELGIRWQESLQAVGQVSLSSRGSTYGLSTNPMATLDLIEKKGWGRILTQPKLVCRNGESASFHAGGEIPIRLISERAAQLIFKPYGILLKMAPLLTPNHQISLTIESEVSTLDGANSVEGIPAILTRKLSTVVSLPSGESLVLGGLIDQNQLKGATRIPGLGAVPWLGELFKSRRFREGETELLVVIRPLLVESNRKTLREEFETFTRKHEEAKSWQTFHTND